MQYESDVQSWKGSEIAVIEVDEVTEMTEAQFFYLFSRNRSMCGIRPYMRAFTNPDADSWVKRVLAPWVDEDWESEEKNPNTPAHLRKRAESGEVRYFVREDDNIRWCDADETNAISITFIAANIFDNKLLLAQDPGYLAGLDALPEVEKRRLKFGDWAARPSGKKFKREWFTILSEMPNDIEMAVRYWDLAATEEVPANSKKSGPDYTAGVLMARRREGSYPRYVILHAIWERRNPGGVEQLVQEIAEKDGPNTLIRIEEEGGSGGKNTIFNFATKVLPGYDVQGRRVSGKGSKEMRANTLSAQAMHGNVGMIKAHWNNGLLNFLVGFPNPSIHDDPVDASSGSMNELFLVPTGPMVWSPEIDAPASRNSLERPEQTEEHTVESVLVGDGWGISEDEIPWDL